MINLVYLQYIWTHQKDRNAKIWLKMRDYCSSHSLLYGLTIPPTLVADGLPSFGSLLWKNEHMKVPFPYQNFFSYNFNFNQGKNDKFFYIQSFTIFRSIKKIDISKNQNCKHSSNTCMEGHIDPIIISLRIILLFILYILSVTQFSWLRISA